MLSWAVLFFIIALVAAVLGQRGVAGMSAQIGYLLVVLALVVRGRPARRLAATTARAQTQSHPLARRVAGHSIHSLSRWAGVSVR